MANMKEIAIFMRDCDIVFKMGVKNGNGKGIEGYCRDFYFNEFSAVLFCKSKVAMVYSLCRF